jgi:hypothetical protein
MKVTSVAGKEKLGNRERPRAVTLAEELYKFAKDRTNGEDEESVYTWIRDHCEECLDYLDHAYEDPKSRTPRRIHLIIYCLEAQKGLDETNNLLVEKGYHSLYYRNLADLVLN